MSSRKIKFSVNGINSVGQRPTMYAALKNSRVQNGKGGYYYTSNNLWSLFGGLFKVFKLCSTAAGFMILIAAIVLTTNFMGSRRDSGLAMVFQSIESEMNGPNYVDGISVENVPLKSEYLYTGGVEKEVLKLKFTSSGEIFRLKNLKVKVGGIDNSEWYGELVLNDNSGGKFRGFFDDGYVNFENLYFRIDEDAVLNLSFVALLPSSLHFGQRIYFEIENPSDIGLSLYGDDVSVKAAYPLRGAYFTFVAKKKIF